MDVQEVFAQRLRMLRNQKGMTQKELAEIIGTTPATISAYESSREGKKISPALENLVAVARVLNVSIDYLCGNDVQKTAKSKIDSTKDYLKAITSTHEIFDMSKGEIVAQIDQGFTRVAGITFPYDSCMYDFLREWDGVYGLYEGKTLDIVTYESIVDVLCNKYAEKIANEQTCPF